MDNKEPVKGVQETAKDRAFREIRNLAMGEAYIAVKEFLPQYEFAKRVKMDPGKLSIIVAKLEEQG